MHRLITIWKTETAYFSERVKENIRRLFVSNTLKSISSPLMTTFLNAFVFRVAGGLESVALYNAGQFVGLRPRPLPSRLIFPTRKCRDGRSSDIRLSSTASSS